MLNPAAPSGNSKPNILCVINSLAGGGAERVFSTFLHNSRDYADRYAINVALLDEEPSTYELPEWVGIHRLDSGGSLWRSIRGVRAIARRLSPQAVLSFLTRSNVAAVLSREYVSGRVVISERVNTTAHLGRRPGVALTRAMVRYAYRHADRVIAVSDGVRNTLVEDFGVDPNRIRVIANPVDAARIISQAQAVDSLSLGEEDWLAMGRLVPNKNFAMAIRSFAKSGATGRLFILGEGPLRENLLALAVDLKVADRVILPGFQSQPDPGIAAACGFLLSSNAEGFPNAMVEAMALGRPVIATDCPSGPSEILSATISDGEPARGRGGILVPCGDHEAMASSMQILSCGSKRRELGIEGQARAREYTVESAVTQIWSTLIET